MAIRKGGRVNPKYSEGRAWMPENLQIELTAEPGQGAERPPDGSTNALVPIKPRALVGSPVWPAIHAKPSSWRRRGLWVGLGASAALGIWLFYAQPWRSGLTEVAVEIVAPGPVTRVLAVNGRIAALRSVTVKSTVAGTLISRLAEEGDIVERGTVLARIDDTAQQAAVREAVAALDQGLVAQQQMRDALGRAQALGSTVSRVALEVAQRSTERAEREVGRLRALVDQAQFELTKFSIAAPIAGTILTRSVDPGQVVDLSTPLFTLADLRELVVEADVDESYATQIRPGMPALLQLTGDPRMLHGRVSFVAPVVDADTGGLAVKIAFGEPQSAPVGLTVTANIIVERLEAAVSAPRAAIVTSESGHAVFVLSEKRAKLVPVSVIDWPADRLIVTDGLKTGDRLIVDANALIDGAGVTEAGH